jgi:hypothetical protein
MAKKYDAAATQVLAGGWKVAVVDWRGIKVHTGTAVEAVEKARGAFCRSRRPGGRPRACTRGARSQ